MAMLLARFIVRLTRCGIRVIKVYTTIMATVAILMTLLLVAVSTGMMPDGLLHGKHAADNTAMVAALGGFKDCWWQFVLSFLPVSAGFVALHFTYRKDGPLYVRHLLQSMFVCVFAVFVTLEGVILPRVMGVKSDRALAGQIMRRYPNTPVYSYLSVNMLHFFGTDFYTGDRIGQFDVSCPDNGVLMVSAHDRGAYLKSRAAEYDFTLDWKTDRPMTEVRDTIYFYRFKARRQ